MNRWRILTWLGVGLLVLFLWSWLAGAVLCYLLRVSLHQATPTLFLRAIPSYFHSAPLRGFMNLAGVAAWVGMASIVFSAWQGQKRPEPFGGARWASWLDVRRSGLFGGKGLILGRKAGRWLTMPGWEHVMVFAPSGSGKGVGLVVPNLLHWPDSAIVHDVKGENFRLTSGYRAATGQKVFFFNPGDPHGHTHRYNPFQFVSSDQSLQVDDLQKIAHLLLPKHDFWENEARTLLVGLALHLLSEPSKPVTFGNILCIIRENTFYDFAYDLILAHCDTMHPVACMALNSFLQKAEKERSGVVSTLSSALELWANPLIDAATSASDFDFRAFKREKNTLYVGVSPNNLHRLRPLLQILYQQATDILTEKEPDIQKEPYGVLVLMDEFASLGKMTQFEQASAYFRGYRVRFMMVLQDLAQLERHYDKAGLHSFLAMSKVKVTFTSGDYHTAELISKYLGHYGAPTVSESRSGRLGLGWSQGSYGRSLSATSRALLLPQEILQLPQGEALILIEGMRPARARKIRYYAERLFDGRVLPPISIPAIKPIAREVRIQSLPLREFSEKQNAVLRERFNLPDPDEMTKPKRARGAKSTKGE